MAQLTMSSIPGFFDLADTAIAGDKPLTDDVMLKISHNAKFAAVRPETFYGWYKNAETVVLPTSPVDGYVYKREELGYEVAAWCTRLPVGATGGTTTKPSASGGNSGAGNLYWCEFWVEEKNEANPGKVHCVVSYYVQGGAETVTNDGFVKVRVIACRLSQ